MSLKKQSMEIIKEVKIEFDVESPEENRIQIINCFSLDPSKTPVETDLPGNATSTTRTSPTSPNKDSIEGNPRRSSRLQMKILPSFIEDHDDAVIEPSKTTNKLPKNNKRQIPYKRATKDCELCGKKFRTSEKLENHIFDVHVIDKEYHCRQCTRSFVSQEKLNVHVIKHTKNSEETPKSSHICGKCGKSFPAAKNLRRHLWTHESKKPFKCDSCSKSFLWNRLLLLHQKNQHGTQKPFKCPICNKGFSRNYLMKDHARIHTDFKPFKCDNCPKAFHNKALLSQHRTTCARQM